MSVRTRGQQIHQLLELLVPRAEALDQSDDHCSVGPKTIADRAGTGAARSNAASRWCQEMVPFLQHRHQALHAAAVGVQRIERGRNPILAARAYLVVRTVEDQGNMNQRGTHHISVTEEVQTANPENA